MHALFNNDLGQESYFIQQHKILQGQSKTSQMNTKHV